MTLYFFGMIAAQIGSAIFTLVLFKKYRSYREKFHQNYPPLATFPGISILIPIKGPAPYLEPSLGAMLKQSYPGPLEIILAFQDGTDPCIEQSKKIVAANPSQAEVIWLTGLPFKGFNPKNSNLSYAYEKSRYSWIFTLDADTICSVNHLKECLLLTQGDLKKFITSVTIHEQGQNLWSMFEGVGTNLEMNLYFLSHYLGGQRPLPINGAAVLFSRTLLDKIGGYSRLVNELAEDATMMNEFPLHGGEGFLSPQYVRVIQREQDFKGLFNRYVRWLMVVRCYMPKLFIIAPFIWWGFWNLLIGVIFKSQAFVLLGSLLIFIRVLLTIKVQALVEVPKEDSIKGFSIIVYDLMMPLFWVAALFRKNIVWAGVKLKVMRAGNLVKVISK